MIEIWSNPLDEQIRSTIEGLQKTVASHPIVKRIVLGSQAIIKLIWWVLGQIPTHFTMMVLFVGAGLINFSLASQASPNSGVSVIAGSGDTSQMMVAALMVCFGAIIGYAKRIETLTIGLLFWLYYGSAVAYGTVTGTISLLGMLAALYLATMVMFAARSSATEYRLEQARTLYREDIADVIAKKELNVGRTNRSSSSE